MKLKILFIIFAGIVLLLCILIAVPTIRYFYQTETYASSDMVKMSAIMSAIKSYHWDENNYNKRYEIIKQLCQNQEILYSASGGCTECNPETRFDITTTDQSKTKFIIQTNNYVEYPIKLKITLDDNGKFHKDWF